MVEVTQMFDEKCEEIMNEKVETSSKYIMVHENWQINVVDDLMSEKW